MIDFGCHKNFIESNFKTVSKTGNPDLKLSRQVNFNFQYNWMPRNNFSAAFYAQYFGEYNSYVPVYFTLSRRTGSSEKLCNRW